MPSSKSKATTHKKSVKQPQVTTVPSHDLFWPVVLVVFGVWLAYRYLTHFPVWFDEMIGKALFFGLPVWFYIASTQFFLITELFNPRKLWSGLLNGLAVGGIFGFTLVLMRLLQGQVFISSAPIFFADNFWYEMAMGLFTSFWETLFFFGFIGNVVLKKYHHWGVLWQAVLVSLIFVLFHLPNTIIRFHQLPTVMSMVFILSLFALGQFLVFMRRRNGYMLVLTQLIWGMALLVYGW